MLREDDDRAHMTYNNAHDVILTSVLEELMISTSEEYMSLSNAM